MKVGCFSKELPIKLQCICKEKGVYNLYVPGSLNLAMVKYMLQNPPENVKYITGSENIEDPFSGGRIIGLCADVTVPESLEIAVNRINEIVIHFCIVNLVFAHCHCNGFALTNTAVGNGVVYAEYNSNHQQCHQYDDKGDGINFQFFGFLLLSQLTLGEFGSLLLVAELFLAGCAHVIISSR